MTNKNIGSFVRTANDLGIGKLINNDNQIATVEYFISITRRELVKVQLKDIQFVHPDIQTRCYYYDIKTSRWMIGRITGRFDSEYQVDFPDFHSEYVGIENLYVRCTLPIDDPMEILHNKGHETAFFNRERTEFVRAIMKQREVARGMEGLISSSISLFPHQIEVIRRVLEDPIPRYLLADEVGLGKTIEAGVIIRQFLLDHPNAKVLIIIPLFLQTQWQTELDNKCNLYEFSSQITWYTKDRLIFGEELTSTQWDLIVIDEAHEIAAMGSSLDLQKQRQYHIIEQISATSRGLLLLSATPVLHNEQDFLSMLHLLDPDHFHLEDVDRFKSLVAIRQDIGRTLFTLREHAKPLLLRKAAERLLTLINDDSILSDAVSHLLASIEKSDEDNRVSSVRMIRAHLTETYRIHRRLLRNRREGVKHLLKHGRDPERGELPVTEEYDLDERTQAIQELMDEWRDAAWAMERNEWQQYGYTHTTSYQRLFIHLIELSNSALPIFREVIIARIAGNVAFDLSLQYEEEIMELLTGTPLFPGEQELLESMVRIMDQPSEEGDRVAHLQIIIDSVVNQAKKRNKINPKIVVFTGYPAVAEYIYDQLLKTRKYPFIAKYMSAMSDKEIDTAIDLFRSEAGCHVLICDSSGEVGRNLQFADVVVHFDLLMRPSRMEQRIGRLDRLGRDHRFSSYIFTGPDYPSLIDAWYVFLNEGLKVFQSSISSLQFLIDQILPEMYGRFYVEGAEGLIRYIRESFAERMEQEQLQVAEQSALDEIDAGDEFVSQYMQNLMEYESNSTSIKESMEGWILSALHFESKPAKEHSGMFRYYPSRRTLLPISTSLALAKKANREGSYERSMAVSQQKCGIYRVGDPFIQMLDDDLKWDDRGRAYAYWRKVRGWNPGEGFEWFGFTFNYIVEGNISTAEHLYKSNSKSHINSKALQRRMDRYLSPFIQSIHVTSDGDLVTDPKILEALKIPFTRLKDYGNDTNLTKEWLNVIDDFITPNKWTTVCQIVRESSEQSLRNDEVFVATCEKNRQIAQREFELQYQQLNLRSKKQQLLGQFDRIELELEESIQLAMLEGIAKPSIRLDSVGFIILSGRELRGEHDE